MPLKKKKKKLLRAAKISGFRESLLGRTINAGPETQDHECTFAEEKKPAALVACDFFFLLQKFLR